ncbi:MAG: hypothetical protein DMF06_07795, partial [Verrucomicrobia bacterium]
MNRHSVGKRKRLTSKTVKIKSLASKRRTALDDSRGPGQTYPMTAFRVFLPLIAACFLSWETSRAETADALFINGNIYTANDRQPRAEAIAVNGSRIIFVGSNA